MLLCYILLFTFVFFTVPMSDLSDLFICKISFLGIITIQIVQVKFI